MIILDDVLGEKCNIDIEGIDLLLQLLKVNIIKMDENNSNNVLLNIPDIQLYKSDIYVVSNDFCIPSNKYISLYTYKHFLEYYKYYPEYEEGFKKDLIELGKKVRDYKTRLCNIVEYDKENDKKIEINLIDLEYYSNEYMLLFMDYLKVDGVGLLEILNQGSEYISEIINGIDELNKYLTFDFIDGIKKSKNVFNVMVQSYEELYRKLTNVIESNVLDFGKKLGLNLSKYEGAALDERVNKLNIALSIVVDVVCIYYLGTCISNCLNNDVIKNSLVVTKYNKNVWLYQMYKIVSDEYNKNGNNIFQDLNNGKGVLVYGSNVIKDTDQDTTLMEKYSDILEDKDQVPELTLINNSSIIYYALLSLGYIKEEKYDRVIEASNGKNLNNINGLTNEIILEDSSNKDSDVIAFYNISIDSQLHNMFADLVAKDILEYSSYKNEISEKMSKFNDVNGVKDIVIQYLSGDDYGSSLNDDTNSLKQRLKRTWILSQKQKIDDYKHTFKRIYTNIENLLNGKNINSELEAKLDLKVLGEVLNSLIVDKNIIGDDIEIEYNIISMLGDKIVIEDNLFDSDRLKIHKILNDSQDKSELKSILLNMGIVCKDDEIVEISKNISKCRFRILSGLSLCDDNNDNGNKKLKIMLKILSRLASYRAIGLIELTMEKESLKNLYLLLKDIILMIISKECSKLDSDYSDFYEEDYLKYYIDDIDRFINKVDVGNTSVDVGYNKLRLFGLALDLGYFICSKEVLESVDVKIKTAMDLKSENDTDKPKSSILASSKYMSRGNKSNRILSQLEITVKDIDKMFNIK